MSKALQLTLAILKPDVVSRPHIVQQIKQIIRNDGFYFIKSKTCYLPRSKAEEFYEEHEGRFFHNRLVTFMSSGQVSVHFIHQYLIFFINIFHSFCWNIQLLKFESEKL
jgi:nucleoside-diphosphate kinase